ncbi:MAG: hypothetical protein ACHQ49_06685 [Elusimicrobiota bacterium]
MSTRVLAVGAVITALLSVSVRAEVAWDRGDPAQASVETVRSAAAGMRALSEAASAIDRSGDCSDPTVSDGSADCASASPASEPAVVLDDPRTVHGVPAHRALVEAARPIAAPVLAAAARVETGLPLPAELMQVLPPAFQVQLFHIAAMPAVRAPDIMTPALTPR